MTAAEALFWAAVTVAGYAYLGYPLLLWLRACLRPAPPIRKAAATPSVSVVIVACNEAAGIAGKIRNCLELDYPRERLEILVASDGSTDGTESVVESFAGEGVRLLSLPGPRGKPAALNAAVPASRGEVLLLCDVRQRLARDALRELVANLADPAVGAASGELHLARLAGSATAEGVGLYWRFEKWVRRLESRVGSTVGVTGAIYVLRRELFEPLDPRTLLDDVAIPLGVARAGYRVVFEPLAGAFDEPSADSAREFRRKVRTLAGSYQLLALQPALRLPGRHPLFWGFVSHKLSRLLVPWCLVVAFLASTALALSGSRLYAGLLGAQILFYALAGAGFYARRLGVGARLLSVPYALALLNLAAAAALFAFLSGRQRVTWKAPS